MTRFDIRAGSKKPAILLALVAGMVTIALLVPLPSLGREVSCFQDMLHVALFAFLGAYAFIITRSRTELPALTVILICWVAVTGFGVCTELAQALVGRDASWQDMLADACGAMAGILWAQTRATSERRPRVALMIAIGLPVLIGVTRPILELTDAVLQRFEMPLLASFESPLEISRWRWSECHVTRTREHATHGDWALQIDLNSGEYPGVVMVYPVRDWARYKELLIDVYLADNYAAANLTVKIQDVLHDGEYTDRFHQTARLSPGPNQIRVSLTDVAAAPRDREMDLKRIFSISLFTASPKIPRTIFIDNLRLR